jgi:opacity protein-like surface antigen
MTPEPTVAASAEVAPPANSKTTTVTKHGRGGRKVEVVVADPDVPARVPAPLYCPLPFEIPPGEDLIVRCLTQKQQKKSTATLFYRSEDTKSEDFVSAVMVRNAKGWLQARVPGDAIKGKSLGYYIEAHIPGSGETMSLGRADAPNAFLIKEGADASNLSEKENILDTLNVKIAEDNDSRLYHRREVGALWLSFAGGTGAAYHARENLDSGATDPQGNVLRSLAGFTPAGQFQAELELGYQLNKDLSLSVMGRYQHAAADSLGYASRPILTSARAAYLRARYAFLTAGNFQAYGSAGAGGGNNFLVIINKQCDATQPGCRLSHSDTLHGGPIGVLLGVGAIYHLSRNFGVFIDVNEVLTLPKFMALTEVNLGLAIAYKLQKSAPPSEDGVIEKPAESESD